MAMCAMLGCTHISNCARLNLHKGNEKRPCIDGTGRRNAKKQPANDLMET